MVDVGERLGNAGVLLGRPSRASLRRGQLVYGDSTGMGKGSPCRRWRCRQALIGQDRGTTRQDKTRQDKTRQNKARGVIENRRQRCTGGGRVLDFTGDGATGYGSMYIRSNCCTWENATGARSDMVKARSGELTLRKRNPCRSWRSWGLRLAVCGLCSRAVVRCSSQMEVNREMANKRPQSGISRFFPVRRMEKGRGDKARYSIAKQSCSLSEPPPVPGPVPSGDWGDWGDNTAHSPAVRITKT